MTVAELANQMALKKTDLISKMMSLGVMATVNQSLDQDTAILITEEVGHNPVIQKENEDEKFISQVKENIDNNFESSVLKILEKEIIDNIEYQIFTQNINNIF